MITFDKLLRDARVFKALTGITVDEFAKLYSKVEPAWVEAESKRLSRPDRQRAIGAGSDYSLDLETRLVMVLFWLRLYLTMTAVGYFFSVDKATVSRNTRRLLPVLRQISDPEFEWSEPPGRGQGKNIERALRDYPELFAILDATEQPVQRSQDDKKQRAHYSGKKKRHTRKTAIVVNEHGEIRGVTFSTPGSVHDITHIRGSGILDKIPKEVGVIGDAGFDGLHKDLPDHSVATAHKARRNHPLTEDQKLINRELSSTRIIVENIFCQLKHFRILAERFRHDLDIYDDIFRTIAAIVNVRTRNRLATTIA
jgi:IS5 family transposase